MIHGRRRADGALRFGRFSPGSGRPTFFRTNPNKMSSFFPVRSRTGGRSKTRFFFSSSERERIPPSFFSPPPRGELDAIRTVDRSRSPLFSPLDAGVPPPAVFFPRQQGKVIQRHAVFSRRIGTKFGGLPSLEVIFFLFCFFFVFFFFFFWAPLLFFPFFPNLRFLWESLIAWLFLSFLTVERDQGDADGGFPSFFLAAFCERPRHPRRRSRAFRISPPRRAAYRRPNCRGEMSFFLLALNEPSSRRRPGKVVRSAFFFCRRTGAQLFPFLSLLQTAPFFFPFSFHS